MADYRQIHTCIWKDSWFLELSSDHKLLFIYLFSNERANLTGLYDLSVKVMIFETDLDRATIEAGLELFAADGKVYYEAGMVWVPSLLRHNARNITSPKIQTHLKGTIQNTRTCPLRARWIEYYNSIVPSQYRIDTVYIPDPESTGEHVHAHAHAPVHVLDRVPVQSDPTLGVHPGILCYSTTAGRKVPSDKWADQIEQTIGPDPPSLERWAQVIDAWIGLGWNPRNVKGMLDFYNRNEIPGGKNNGRNKQPATEVELATGWLTDAEADTIIAEAPV